MFSIATASHPTKQNKKYEREGSEYEERARDDISSGRQHSWRETKSRPARDVIGRTGTGIQTRRTRASREAPPAIQGVPPSYALRFGSTRPSRGRSYDHMHSFGDGVHAEIESPSLRGASPTKRKSKRGVASIRVLTEPSGIKILREGDAAVCDLDRDDA